MNSSQEGGKAKVLGKMKKLLVLIVAMISFGALAAVPKYVFLFIGDGMAVPQRMTADEFSRARGDGPLAMNALPFSATTRTCSADSLVTDSAAAATAIACGSKTKNHSVGVDERGDSVFSSAKAAKDAGLKVGIASTATITHATPAGFYAHSKSRGDMEGIARDLADSGFDFFAGGGLDVREEKSKAYDYAVEKGYRIVRTKQDFLSLGPGDGKILTRFTNGPLETAIDVNEDVSANQPTLAEIVAKGIEMLDNDKGFFLMAEGGRIDWAGHANDAATNLRDVLALDEAVKVALAFLEKRPDETLVVVTGDHETGGMSMGFAGTGYALYMDRLANQTMSVGRFESKAAKLFSSLKDEATFDAFKPLMTEAFGFAFEGDAKENPMVLSKDELKQLSEAFVHDLAFHESKIEENKAYDGEKLYLLGGACRLVMSHKCGIGWSSGVHTAMPVLTTAKGVGAEKFSGFIENTDISKIMKSFYR